MTGTTLLRGIYGLAIPVLAVLTLRKRASAHSEESHASEASIGPKLNSPSAGELSKLINSGESLARLDLSGIDLHRADLRSRALAQADLSRARLSKARLSGADLSGAILHFADMSRCDLVGADLTGASLLETSLWEADLRGADLSSCRNIIMANLRRARFDATTKWPARLDPEALGAIRTDRRRNSSSG